MTPVIMAVRALKPLVTAILKNPVGSPGSVVKTMLK